MCGVSRIRFAITSGEALSKMSTVSGAISKIRCSIARAAAEKSSEIAVAVIHRRVNRLLNVKSDQHVVGRAVKCRKKMVLAAVTLKHRLEVPGDILKELFLLGFRQFGRRNGEVIVKRSTANPLSL